MNPEQWLSLKWNGGSTMSDRWLNQSKIIHFTMDNYIVGMIYIRRFHYLNENIKWQEEKRIKR